MVLGADLWLFLLGSTLASLQRLPASITRNADADRLDWAQANYVIFG